MKTILYQPIFINPQAYFVFPQLYHIEKGDSYIEPANITGQLIINNLSDSNVNQAINQIKQAEQQAISNFSSQKVSPEMLSESTKQLINASGGGTITNLADDEDIESVGQDLKVLKFADRTYNPVAHIGNRLHYKYW